jgi:hypothetical protein
MKGCGQSGSYISLALADRGSAGLFAQTANFRSAICFCGFFNKGSLSGRGFYDGNQILK